MISYTILYIVNHPPNASILDAPVTIQELCSEGSDPRQNDNSCFLMISFYNIFTL